MKVIFKEKQYNVMYVIKTSDKESDEIYSCEYNYLTKDRESTFTYEDAWVTNVIFLVLDNYDYILIDGNEINHRISENHKNDMRSTITKLRDRMIIQ